MKLSKVTGAGGVELVSESGFRVRYSRVNGAKKNTLLTLADKNGTILFGIARLSEGDQFNKKIGRSLAASRLKAAIDTWGWAGGYQGDTMKASPNLLWGVCPANMVEQLVIFFRNIDQSVNEARFQLYEEKLRQRLTTRADKDGGKFTMKKVSA